MKLTIRNYLFLFTVVLSFNSSAESAEKFKSVAVIGDSGATGIMADPRIFLSYSALGRSIPKPTNHNNVDLSSFKKLYDEFEISLPLNSAGSSSGLEGYPNHFLKFNSELGRNLEIVFQSQLNFREMTWAFLATRSLVSKASDINLYSINGKRIGSIHEEVDVMKIISKDEMPEATFVSFTANDFCADNVFLPEEREIALNRYAKDLKEGLEKLSSMKKSLSAHHVYVLAPMPVTKILSSDEIADKKIYLPIKGETTCRDIRSGDPIPVAFSKADYGVAIRKMCPSILSIKPEDKEKIAFMEALYKDVLNIQKTTIEDLKLKAASNVIYHYIPEIFDIDVKPKDIANDCFHPSIYGHAKVARILKSHLLLDN